MSADPTHANVSSEWDDASLEVDELLAALAQLSKSATTAQQFFKAMLDRVVPALGAVGGAVWRVDATSTSRLLCEINLRNVKCNSDAENLNRHDELLRAVCRQAKPQVVPPFGRSERFPGAENPTRWLLLLLPVHRHQGQTAVIEVFQRQDISRDAQQAQLHFLEALGELADDFHRNLDLRSLEQREAFWAPFEALLRKLHSGSALKQTAYLVANDGRCLLDCDRLSVALFRRRCRILAVSNLPEVERRAPQVRLLEELSSRVLKINERLWWDGSSSDLPPELEDPLHEYLDQSHVRTLGVLPLTSDPEGSSGEQPIIGALIVEKFVGEPVPDIRQRAELMAGQAGIALKNSLDRRYRGFLGVPRLLAWFMTASRIVKASLVALLLGGIFAFLIAFEADFAIEARGTLQPLQRRDVFAPGDGVVQEVFVHHGQLVTAGMPVAVLRDPQLDLDLKRAFGELQTARKRLAAIEAERIVKATSGYNRSEKFNQLTAEEEELKESLKNLETQFQLLTSRRAELTVLSPIAGCVTTWDVGKLLLTRPVSRGQTLMTIADTDGDWVLEVEVSDDDISYVQAAQVADGNDLPVEFTLATDPGTPFRGKLDSLAVTAEQRVPDLRSVSAIVDVEVEQMDQPTPGATAVAHIQCGRRPIGFVWFRDLIEAVQSIRFLE